MTEVEKIRNLKAYQQEEAILAMITDDDQKYGQIFSEWSKQEIQSLEKIETSINYIKWVRNLENFQEFKFFVQLASISAGESDTEVDRVLFMNDATSGYSQLIFDVGPNSSFEEFLIAIEHLFRALDDDEYIPE